MEKEIEKRLRNEVKKRGGLCLKWVSPGMDGVPDRLIFMPGRKLGLVEVKAPGKKPRKLQVKVHRMLERLGFEVDILDGADQIDDLLDRIEKRSKEL